jgi:hypothetical protein
VGLLQEEVSLCEEEDIAVVVLGHIAVAEEIFRGALVEPLHTDEE